MIPISSFWHMRPNCVTGTFPCSCSFSVGSRTYTFFQSVYSASGTPYFSIHCRNTRAAAQMVSSSPRGLHRRGRIVHHVHQAGPRASLLIPLMKTAVQLHQLAEVGLALAPLPVRLTFPHLAPQPFGQHPAPQRFRMNL